MTWELLIHENAGIERSDEYVRVAVPCARGELQPDSTLVVSCPAGQPQRCQAKTLKQWPDGSVKWLLADFAATVAANSSNVYTLSSADDNSLSEAQVVRVIPAADAWQVDTGVGTFTIDASRFRPFAAVHHKEEHVLISEGSSCQLITAAGTEALAVVTAISCEDDGPLHAILCLAGHFHLSREQRLAFSCRLHFFAGSMTVQIEFTIRNPGAAHHPGGLWDLGDHGSVLFKGLNFSFPLAMTGAETGCIPEPGLSPLVVTGTTRLSLYQESSGGENWHSPTHRSRAGVVPMERNGYLLEQDGHDHATGRRATPVVWCGDSSRGVAVAFPGFWQEFPKAIEADNSQLTVALFPARFPDLHELQGGEQKTHNFHLDFSADGEHLTRALHPLQVMASPADYRVSGIFADLPGHDDLIDRFAAPDDIMAKREVADEYGWRNYGELYADHEAAFHQGDTPFVSHYNNQYDFIAGAYRTCFASGDQRWGGLAGDLARHVRDIDIYHTDEDRDEYNHGLFWHTDHYLDAGLSSHRSYSREQLKNRAARSCGGGPGPEHCYTTGLMLHYFQTGNPDFKQAVVDLAEWVLRALDGPQTVLAALKRGMTYFRRWQAARGSNSLFPRYPLTRGTGNGITACLDAYEVGGGYRFMEKAEELIKGALHPGDDIAARNLLDAEIAWSYTVLLGAVAKYLDKKCELGECDTAFAYARASLLAYAEWMLVHEYPYLDKPEILEYPNETWPAQDIRKSVIFFQAARYAVPDRKEAFIAKARQFYNYAADELLRHSSSARMRPLTLMLQNGWVGARLCGSCPLPLEKEAGMMLELADYGQPTPGLQLGSVLGRIGRELARALKETTLQREIAWIRARVS